MIDQETLKTLFNYDAITGNLINRQDRSGRARAGSIAGNRVNNQIVTTIAGTRHLVCNLVWVYHHGEIQNQTVVHINGNPIDNRIENLRLQADIARAKDYEPDVFLQTLAYELDLLNIALIQHGLDGKTRIRVMRSFANLHKLPSNAKDDEPEQQERMAPA